MPECSDYPRVQLQGHLRDLESLATVFSAGKHQVNSEDGMFWLRSTEFDGLAGDPKQARAVADELLPLINGTSKALIPGFEPVELGQCVDWIAPDGRLKRRLSEKFILHCRPDERITPERSASISRQIEDWISLGRSDERVADVLRSLGKERLLDWDALFKLKEKIHAAVGSQVVQLGWATKAELRRFDHTANSPSVLGDDARHGVQRSDPPRNPMKITEARELVERLVRCWIDELTNQRLRRP